MNKTALPNSLLRRTAFTILLLASALTLALSPYLVSAGQAPAASIDQTVTDMTQIELPSSESILAAFGQLGITSRPGDREGYLQADVTKDQLRALDSQGLTYAQGQPFVLIQGRGLSGEASVIGSNGTNVAIIGNDTVTSDAHVSGTPSGKTVIRADVGVVLNYPQMCNIYIMAFHPTWTMWFHAWTGNQNPCTANLNKQWLGIHDFDFADINGNWHLQVQETNGQSVGYLDSWFIRLYYQADATATPTRTATPPVRKLFLPLIISEF